MNTDPVGVTVVAWLGCVSWVLVVMPRRIAFGLMGWAATFGKRAA